MVGVCLQRRSQWRRGERRSRLRNLFRAGLKVKSGRSSLQPRRPSTCQTFPHDAASPVFSRLVSAAAIRSCFLKLEGQQLGGAVKAGLLAPPPDFELLK